MKKLPMPHARAATALGLAVLLISAGVVQTAQAAPSTAVTVGQGLTLTPGDLAYILRQIKVAEAHVAHTTPETGPCGALVGPGPDQVPDVLTAYGLRTVDGSCNNLVAGRERYAAA